MTDPRSSQSPLVKVLKNPRFRVVSIAHGENSGKAKVPARERIRWVFEHISKRYTEKLTVQDALAICSLSRSHFHGAFQRVTGMTFNEYITRFRVEEAMRLLGNSPQETIDIGFACGFGSVSRFYEAFQAQTGTTPRTYRLRVGKG